MSISDALGKISLSCRYCIQVEFTGKRGNASTLSLLQTQDIDFNGVRLTKTKAWETNHREPHVFSASREIGAGNILTSVWETEENEVVRRRKGKCLL